MAKIYLIRHCESEGNACRRTQAQVDALVTMKGYEQNEMLRRRFKDIDLSAAYSSDSFRSIMTAKPIADEKKIPIRVRISLREITTGVWEDMAWGNIAEDYPEANKEWNERPWAHITPGAGSFQSLAERMLHGLRRIAGEVGEDGSALVVSHSCSIKAVLCVIHGEPLENMKKFGHCDNTAVSLLDISRDGEIKVEYMNDDSHLPAHLKRAWGGVAGDDINMSVHGCRLPEQADELLKLARMDACERGEAFDETACLADAERLLKADPESVAFSYLKGQVSGFVVMSPQGELPSGCGYVRRMYVVPELQGKEKDPTILTKTGFMVGLGETEDQISRLMDDVLAVGCDILTIGQYLQPTPNHYPLARYATPEDFIRWKELALAKGFRHVASAPLARSSYKALEALEAAHDLH